MKHLLLLLSLFVCLGAKANTVVIGSGSGTVSQTSMTGLSSGDILAITPGTYSGATFSNLNGITITSNGGTVTFSGSNYFEIGSGNTNLTITYLNFLNITNDAFLLTGTNTQGLYIYHCTFTNVTNNMVDVSGYNQAYTGINSTLKLYRFAMDNCKFTNCGQVWQGWYGTPADLTDLCDSVEMGYDTVVNTATNGTEIAGPITHVNIHHWRITYAGANPVTGDVGAFQLAGDGQVHDCYFKGGRGYLVRQLAYGLNAVGAFYFYNNIIYGQNAYGAIDIRCDPANYGTNAYLFKCNSWLYNCTMGNKTDINGYVCPVAIVGVLGNGTNNATCTIRNMFAFNNQYGANPIANNNANGTWAIDTANDLYATASQAVGLVQDTTTTFMPTSSSYLNTHGDTTGLNVHPANPDLYGYSGTGTRIGAVYYESTLATPPTLTPAVGATVDLHFPLTFTDDATWRSNVTSVLINGVTLSSSAWALSAGILVLYPTLSPLLQTAPQTYTISVIATGYSNDVASQLVGVGQATQLSLSIQPTAPASNGAILATQPVVNILDQYNNQTTSTASVAAAISTGTLGGTLTKTAVSGIATFTNLTATSVSSVTATITFTSSGLTSVTSNSFVIPAPPVTNCKCGLAKNKWKKKKLIGLS